MSKQQDPDWEVVDKLPGEDKPKPAPRGLNALLKNKTLWIGILIGAAAIIVIPVVRVLFLNAIRAWWLWLGLALYWIWRRMQKTGKKR